MTYPKYPLETKWPIDNVTLSLVIPAYNEESRISSMIFDCIKFLKTLNLKYEIIIVNDGSRDKTWDIIKNTMNKYPEVEIYGVTYKKNGGKGWAVTNGMRYAKGQYILMLDADGATQIQDYMKLREEMSKLENLQQKNQKETGVLVIGSRQANLEETQIKVNNNLIQNLEKVVS